MKTKKRFTITGYVQKYRRLVAQIDDKSKLAKLRAHHNKFLDMLRLDDNKLLISNANERINLDEDPAYSRTQKESLKEKIRNRETDESDYWGIVFPVEKELIRIAGFFENKEKALELLKEHTNGNFIIKKDGSKTSIEEFSDQCENAYQKRIKHGIPHKIALLEIELSGDSLFPNCLISKGRIPRTPNLDEIENWPYAGSIQ